MNVGTIYRPLLQLARCRQWITAHLTTAAMAVSGLRMTTSWLSTLRVIRLVGVTTSRLGTVLPPA